MLLQPSNLEELQSQLKECAEAKKAIAGVALGSINRLVEHQAEDLTATAEAGMTLSDFQRCLGEHNQWLPVDPPNPEKITLAQLIDHNLSGSRRFGYGQLRDYLIGLRVMMGDGTLIRCGGKVVKNVAGFDLCKLFVGSRGTLGVPVEATFKLLPKPNKDVQFAAFFQSVGPLETAVTRILASETRPVILDAYRIPERDPAFVLVIGLDGLEVDVEWQADKLQGIASFQPASLDYLQAFHPPNEPSNFNRTHVLPSRVFRLMEQVPNDPWLAHVGHGAFWHRGRIEHVRKPLPLELLARTKRLFDPHNVFPKP